MVIFLNWLSNVLDAFKFRLGFTDSSAACDDETENITSSPDSEDDAGATGHDATTTRQVQENPVPSGTEIYTDTLNFPDNAAEGAGTLNAGNVDSSNCKETDISCHRGCSLSDSSVSCRILVQSKTETKSLPQYEILSVSQASARSTETLDSCSKSETSSQAHKKTKKRKSGKSKLGEKVTVTKNPNTIASSWNPSHHGILTESSLSPSTDRTTATKAASGLNADVLCPPHSNTTHKIDADILDFHGNAVEGFKTLNAGKTDSSNFEEAEISDILDVNELPWESVGSRKQKSKAKSLSQSEILPGSQLSASTSKIANSSSKSKKAPQGHTKKPITSRNSKLNEKVSVTRNLNTKALFGSSSHRRIPTENSLPPSTITRTTGIGACAGISYSEAVKRASSTKTDIKTDLNVTEGSSGSPSVDVSKVRDNDNVLAPYSANAENETGDNAQKEQVNSNLALILSSQTSSNCTHLIASNPYRFNPVVGLPVTFPNLSCNLYETRDNSLRILEGEDDTFSDPFDSDFADDSVLNLPSLSLPVINTLPKQFESQAPLRIPNQSSNLHEETQHYLPILESVDTSSGSIGSYFANDSVFIPTPPTFPANNPLFGSCMNLTWAPSETESTDNSLKINVSDDQGRCDTFSAPRNSIPINSNLVYSPKPSLDEPEANTSSVSEDVFPSIVTTVYDRIVMIRGVPHTNSQLFPQIIHEHALLNTGFPHTSPTYQNRAFSPSLVSAVSNIAVRHNSAYRLASNSEAVSHTSANRLVSDRTEQHTLADRPVSNHAVPHTSAYRQTSNSAVLHTPDNKHQTLNRSFLNTSVNRPVSDSAVLHTSTYRQTSNSATPHTSDDRRTVQTFNTANRAVLHTSANRPVSDSLISQNSTSRSVPFTRSQSFPGHPVPINAFHHTGNSNFAAFSSPFQANSTPPSQRPGTFQYPQLKNVYQPHDQAYDNFRRASHSGMGQPIPSVPSHSTAFSPQSFSCRSANPQPVEFIPRPNSSAAVRPRYSTELQSNRPFSHQAATGIQTFRQANNQSVTYQTYDSPSGIRTIHTVATEVRQTCYTRQFTCSDDPPSTELSRTDSDLRDTGARNRRYRSITNPPRFRNRLAHHVSPHVNASKLPGKPRNQLSTENLQPKGVNLGGPSSKPTYLNLPVSAEENENDSGKEKHGRNRSASEMPNPRHFTNAQPGQQSGFRRSTSYPGPRNKQNKPPISEKE